MIHTFPLVNTPEAFLFLLAQEFQAIPVPPGPGEFQAVPVGGAHGNTKGDKPKQPQHKSRSCGIIRPLGAGDDLQGINLCRDPKDSTWLCCGHGG